MKKDALTRKKLQRQLFFCNDNFPEDRSMDIALSTILKELSAPSAILQTNIRLFRKFRSLSNAAILNDILEFCEISLESIFKFLDDIEFLTFHNKNNQNRKQTQISIELLERQIHNQLKLQNFDLSRLVTKIGGNNRFVELDEDKLSRIIFQLLSNALKFSRNKVILSINSADDILTLIVHDSGIGILSEDLTSIFTPFVKGSNAKTNIGLGLGLPIVVKSVKSLNGSMLLKTAKEEGTEVRIELPIGTFNKEIPNTSFDQQIFFKTQKVRRSNINEAANIDFSLIISTISHELRTPVSILKSNIQLLNRFDFEFDQILKDESLHLSEEAITEIEHFLNALNELNSSYKTLPFKISKIDFEQLIKSVYNDLIFLGFDCNRVAMHINLIHGDVYSMFILLRQVLFAGLSNALKFSDGSVHIFISSGLNEFSITIEDYGIGIPKSSFEKVFIPFFRSENAGSVRGAGIGLSLLNSIVSKIGGKIDLSSEMNRGTKITITLKNELSNKNTDY